MTVVEEAINKFLVEQNNTNNLSKITRTVYSITLNRGPVIKTDEIDLKADKVIISFDLKHKLFRLKYIFSNYEKYNLTERPSMIKFYRINAIEL
jgi:archaellin